MRLRLTTVGCGKSGGHDCDNGIGSGSCAACRLSAAMCQCRFPHDFRHKKPPCWRLSDEDPVVLADFRYCLCDVADLLDVFHLLNRVHNGLAVAGGGEGVHAGEGESAFDGGEKLALVHNVPFVVSLFRRAVAVSRMFRLTVSSIEPLITFCK